VVKLAEILRRHWPAYEARFGNAIPLAHRRAVAAILSCRSPTQGGQLYRCDCGQTHFAFHSCGHRACNQCVHGEAAEWSTRQTTKLLPVPYFLVTFTVPEQLRRPIRSHQAIFYPLLFGESAGTLQDVAANPKHLGATLGLLGVLHTWTRQLEYHPHLHYLVPGGGLSSDGLRWKRVKNPGFFLPQPVLAARWRNRFKEHLRTRHPELFGQIPAKVWLINWVVDVQPAGRGQAALHYLAAYVQKTALSAPRLLACDERTVTFIYRDRVTGRNKTCRLTGEEFLRRFLQHVLPKGFQRVRTYGWLSAAATKRWQRIHALLDWKAPPLQPTAAPPPILCPCCQQPMRLVGTFPRGPPSRGP
jgi:hypothetical protein